MIQLRLRAMGTLLCLALLAGACSSGEPATGGEAEPTESGSAAEGTESPSAAEPSADDEAREASPPDESGLEMARAVAQENLEDIQIEYDPGPLPGSVEGMRFACVHLPVTLGRVNCEYFTNAASKLGATVDSVDAGSSAEEVVDTFERLLQEEAYDGFYVSGYEPNRWQAQYDQLIAAGVPVVLSGSRDDPAWSDTSVNILSTDRPLVQSAKIAADWIISDSEGRANTVYVNIPVSPALALLEEGFREEFSASCPDCLIETVNAIGYEAIGRDIPGQVVSHLQSNPDVTYVYAGFGDMLSGVPQALAAAGIDGVKLVSITGSQLNYQLLVDGDQDALVAYPQELIHGYVAVDALARGAVGGVEAMSYPGSWVTPVQIITPDSVGSSQLLEDGTIGLPDLEAHFDEVWGL